MNRKELMAYAMACGISEEEYRRMEVEIAKAIPQEEWDAAFRESTMKAFIDCELLSANPKKLKRREQ